MSRFLLLLSVILLTVPQLAVAADRPEVESAFSPKQGATDLVVKAVGEAHKTIRVAAYLMTSRAIANALIRAAKNGVDVKVVLDRLQCDATGSLDYYLAQNGIAVRRNSLYANMHDKFMVIDGNEVELGSFNYTRTAEEKNAENVLVLHNAPETAARYQAQWDRLWNEAH